MDKYINNIIKGDCLSLLKGMKNNSIDYVITSPPYNVGGDFHTMVNGKRVSYKGYNGKKNDNLNEEEYQNNQIEVLDELYRVLKDDGILFYNHKNRIKDGVILSPLEWVLKSKFYFKQEIILNFKTTPNTDKRRCFPIHEQLYILTKDQKLKLNNELNYTDIWDIGRRPRRITKHPATFHESLPSRCLDIVPKKEGIVLDPYSGSGTTLKIAKERGYDYIGFEIEDEYCKLIMENLK